MLEMTAGIDYPGQLKWELCLCLLGAWMLLFLCLVKGIKSSGKVRACHLSYTDGSYCFTLTKHVCLQLICLKAEITEY